jgi:hypothetical protein
LANTGNNSFDSAFLLFVGGSAQAAGSFADSNVITVDTRNTALTVSGRMRDGQSGAALIGVLVQVGGQSQTTGANGQFTFANAVLSAGGTVRASKSGYAAYQQTAQVPAGSSQVTLPDILLQPLPQGPGPVVTGIQPEFDGLFLSGVPLQNTFTAAVDWRGVTPGAVRFYANDQLIETVAGAGPEYRVSVNMGTAFTQSLRSGSNRLRVIAENAQGAASAPASREVSVIPLPSGLTFFLPDFGSKSGGGEITASVSFDIPKAAIKATVSLPVLGEFGVQLAARGARLSLRSRAAPGKRLLESARKKIPSLNY